jgi:hypothetical protein
MYGQAGQAIVTNNPGQPQRSSQVQNEVERGAKLIACIQEKIKSLGIRLQSVISEGPSSPQAGAKAERPMLVGHASALANHNDQLEDVDSALAYILDHLEL